MQCRKLSRDDAALYLFVSILSNTRTQSNGFDHRSALESNEQFCLVPLVVAAAAAAVAAAGCCYFVLCNMDVLIGRNVRVSEMQTELRH